MHRATGSTPRGSVLCLRPHCDCCATSRPCGAWSARFSASPAEIVQKISDAEQAFADLSRDKGPRATVELRRTGAFPVFTYYRFDHRCIGVLYTQVNKRMQVPAFECERGGTLHTFFSDQFSVLWALSSVRSLEKVSERIRDIGERIVAEHGEALQRQ